MSPDLARFKIEQIDAGPFAYIARDSAHVNHPFIKHHPHRDLTAFIGVTFKQSSEQATNWIERCWYFVCSGEQMEERFTREEIIIRLAALGYRRIINTSDEYEAFVNDHKDIIQLPYGELRFYMGQLRNLLPNELIRALFR